MENEILEAAPSPEELEARTLAQEHADWMDHPHSQLSQIVDDLQVPRVDINDRIGAIQRNTLALAQFLRRHAGEAPPKPGEKQEEVA